MSSAASKTEPTLLIPTGESIDLDKCPVGLFTFEGAIGIKTASGLYFCAENGAVFWGGVRTAAARNRLRVVPFQIWGRNKPSPTLQADPEMARLVNLASGFADSWNPTWLERARIWNEAFELFEEGIGNAKDVTEWAKQIRRWLFVNVPAVARTEDALRRAWQRKYDLWVGRGRGVLGAFARSHQATLWNDQRIPKRDDC